jgi:RNA 2',3'-cyclic 3'-phosphodiesterase
LGDPDARHCYLWERSPFGKGIADHYRSREFGQGVAEMSRLFVALDLPEEIKRSLEPLGTGLGDVRWLEPGQQHLTLRFLGQLDNGWTREVADALALVPGIPFELRLKGIGHFPLRGEPRVLWVGVEKSLELQRLKRRIDRVLDQAGLSPDARKFAPHVTIARIRGPLSPTRLGTYLMRHSLYRSEAFAVSSFHLYSSWPRSDGAEHQIEVSYELVPGLDE